MHGKRMVWLSRVVMLLLLVLAACSQGPQSAQISQTLDDLAAKVQQIDENITSLHEEVHALDARVSAIEQSTQRLSLDTGRVAPTYVEFLPDPPPGKVTVQLLAKVERGALPGTFTFHLAPEGAQLFDTRSVPAGESIAIGPEIKDGIAFVEPGKLYRLQVIYRNPTDTEARFLVRGGLIDPPGALPFVRNRCWCAAIPFSAPPHGIFSRIIEVGVGPDTPPGAKAVVIFPVVPLP